MKFRSLAALAALTLATAPVVAQAASADLGRALAPVSGESEVGGESTLLVVLGVIALGVGIFLIADNDDDEPASAG